MKTSSITKPMAGSLQRLALALALAAGLTTGSAQAEQTMALTGHGETGIWDVDDFANGYRFTTLAPLEVNWLGIYDAPNGAADGTAEVDLEDTGDDLLEEHRVSIWRESDGVLMARTVVQPGDDLIGVFRGRSVDPVLLDANTAYVIAADYGSGPDLAQWGNDLTGWNLNGISIEAGDGRWGTYGGDMPTGEDDILIGPTFGYTLGPLSVWLTSPADSESYETGTSISATAAVSEPGSFNNTVTFHVTPVSPAGATVETVSTDTSSPFSVDLGALPAGTYEIYATVVNDNSPADTDTSATHTFTVADPLELTMALTGHGSNGLIGDSPEADGYRFTTLGTPIEVGWLGIYDAPNGGEGTVGDDLLEEHRVSIWRESDGVLMAQTVVQPGDDLVGVFRGRSVDPVLLDPNTAYVIAADYATAADRKQSGNDLTGWELNGITIQGGRYGGPGGGMPTNTWSIMIGPTFGYTLGPLTVTLNSPSNNQSYETGTSITAAADVSEPGPFNNTVTFHVTPVSPAGATVETVSTDTSSPFSADLGALPAGTYEIYATVINDNDPVDTDTSATHTFTVADPPPPLPIQCQVGVLVLTANGGINPNTGVAWQLGDQYRLAFYTAGTTTATSNDPAFYNDFVTAQAQQNPALEGIGFTALVTVNLDGTVNQEDSPKSDPRVVSGTDDWTGGAGVGGAGVPVYVMNGTTAIARNNADIWNNWSNPFDGDAVIRLASGTTNLNSDGNPVTASQNVHYSPFLNQFGLGDSADVHGVDIATGTHPTGTHVDALGDTLDNTGHNRGNTNANTTDRVWIRFGDSNDGQRRFYAISELLEVISTAGPGNPYEDWAAGFAGLTDPDPTLDFDGGSLATGLEWVLGGNPTDPTDDATITPTFDNSSDPDFFVFTYRRTDEAAADANTTIMVEYGSDLAGWTDAVAGADIEISVDDDGAGADIDLVEVKIRRTLAVDGKLFARLKVEITTP